MAQINLKTSAGKDGGTLKVNDDIFKIEPNSTVMHEVVRAQQACWRQGTHNTKTRGMVAGGGAKPYRQKGTGRARQGSLSSPHYRGGGVVFGPHTRSHNLRVNKKVVKLAMRSALSAKLKCGELTVVDKFDFEKPSTKQGKAALQALKAEGRVTVVIDDEDLNTWMSLRNIKGVNVLFATESNTYDFIDNASLVMTKDAVKYVEEVLK